MDQRVGESLVARVVSGAALRLQPHTRGRQKEMLGWVAQNGHEVERFVKFGLVGISGTCIDMGVLNLLILVFGWPKFWANTCSFTLAALSNFTWNRLWSFPESRQRPVISQLGQFFLVSVVGYVLSQVIFLSLDAWVFAPWGTLGYNVAKGVAVLVVLFWNFGVNRVWTYRGL